MRLKLISFETAKLAKEKGFSNGSDRVYNSRGELLKYYNYAYSVHDEAYTKYINYKSSKSCEASTQALLQKWLRDKHNIQISITCYHTYTSNHYFINVENNSIDIRMGHFDTYEEALEEALIQALHLIQKF